MSASVASKYSNLPDIDLTQPDVYETPDVEDQMDLDDSPDQPLSDDIETASLPAHQAAERFRLASGDSSSTSALARYQKSLFRSLQLESLSGPLEVSSATTAAAGAGAGASANAATLSETKEQRLRRLVYETQELKEQMAVEQADEKNKNKREGSVRLMELAGSLNAELEKLARSESSEGSLVAPELWRRLDAPAASEDGMQVDSRKPRTQTDAPSALEQRIAVLEKILGSTSSGAPSAGRSSLVDAVARMRQQLDVLADPNRIEGIQRRIKQVLVDMERLEIANAQSARAMNASAEDKAAARLDPATVKRIDQVYEKLTSVDSLIELAPATAKRLQSLATLHVEASEAVARIGRIEKEQGGIKEELAVMKEVAESLRAAVGENAGTLKENMKHIDSRIAALNDRLQVLPSKK
ncbi:hypothetical protein LPJ53_005216 [Coemansia erecta]|uniref:Dynactin subunit 2 n=1 Tax=Coemansia erecta TaxID=147472 RepID=A0A9W8CQH6_9FUNG|nr:hypothetical protein LPJ53_005216 [Coemansia erecta]